MTRVLHSSFSFRSLPIRLFPPSFEPWPGGDADRSVAVLMSGGVDSSVTALLLREAGWKALGITMKIPVAERCSHPRPCCGADAALVCRQLGMAHYFIDVEDAFERHVVSQFRRAYEEGRTPNPCVDCNTDLKFRVVWDFVTATFGARYLATGHYARVREMDGTYVLSRAVDHRRDQSYFLYGIAADRLPYLLFPLGERTKPEVRETARANGLSVADKPDSMELCFAGEGDYRAALDPADGRKDGPILDVDGNVIGRHDGTRNYTIGQRRGLRVAAGKPMYVARISPATNSVTLATREQVSRRDVRAVGMNVLRPELLTPGRALRGKIRSAGEPAPCVVSTVSGSDFTATFDRPQFAPTPGQRLVLYDDADNVVAGGVIGGDF